MSRAPYILLGLAVGACASTAGPESHEPLLRESTILRHDGTAITLEELEAMRALAAATADTIARLERELHEPGLEDRDATILVEALTRRHPSDTRHARTLWEAAEPVGRGRDRARFREYAYYRNQVRPALYPARPDVCSLEEFAGELLASHDDQTSSRLLLAAWRRFAPMVKTRGPQNLASDWRLELDYFRPLSVSLSESMLGPHLRCAVENADDVSFAGPKDSWDGYTAPALLLDLMLPGPECPLGPTVAALARLAAGESIALPVTIAGGRAEDADEADLRFLQAALGGLQAGACALQDLPSSTLRFSATFAYLVDLSEARAHLTFRRTSTAWELEAFDYEPAAAGLLGGSARLDLLPAIRGLAGHNPR